MKLKNIFLLLSVIILFFLQGCSCSPLTSFQPNVPEGGRAVSITVKPGDVTRMLVASETGGVFRTSDGGTTWQHIDALPSYYVYDIAYAPNDANVVIAVTRQDYKIGNSGIWRSSNGGTSWTQPTNATPAVSTRCPEHVSAYAVSFEPGSNNVYVGTDCGVAKSTDKGLTWTHIVPDSSTAVNATRTQNRVWDVLAQSGGRINIAADDGVFYSTDGGGSWQRNVSGPSVGQGGVIHALAASPLSASHLFLVAGGNHIYGSTDGGAHWNQINSTSVNNRQAFVRVATLALGVTNQFMVYFGDGVNMYRQTFTHHASGPVGAGSWTQLTVDHADPADIAFGTFGNPILLATDGGVHKTTDNGSHWTLAGGGTGGFNALQITEVIGQSVLSSADVAAHQDYYYGTQDNYIYVSPDGGSTWPNRICCEGFFLRVPPLSIGHQHSQVTGVTCGACYNFLSEAHLQNKVAWHNPADGDTISGDIDGNPFYIKNGHYIQNTINNDTSPNVNRFKLTQDTGSTWTTKFDINVNITSRPLIAAPGGVATIYQGVRHNGVNADGIRRLGLYKISNLYGPGAPVIDDADVNYLGSLGYLPTMFAWYTVFGVDPADPDHLIAVDVETDEVKYSYDGGQNWFVNNQLTNLVTGGGAYRFRIKNKDRAFPLISVIAFDPANTCHVLAGTMQNGIFRSSDGGATWSQVEKSRKATYITSFYFPSTGKIVVSTYGRGLWKLERQTGGTCPQPELTPVPIPGARVWEVATGTDRAFKGLDDEVICVNCNLLIVKNGQITDFDLEQQQLKSLAISGGSLFQYDKQGKEVPLYLSNKYQNRVLEKPLLGRLSDKLAQLDRRKEKVRGLIVKEGQVVAVVTSLNELAIQTSRTRVCVS